MGRKLEYPRECKHCDAKGTDGVMFRHRTCCMPCFEQRKTREYKTPAYVRAGIIRWQHKQYIPVFITRTLGLPPKKYAKVSELQSIYESYNQQVDKTLPRPFTAEK